MQASDLHLIAGKAPLIRVNSRLLSLESLAVLSAEDIGALFESMVPSHDRHRFLAEQELDFSYTAQGLIRFRGNACMQRGSIKLSLRVIPMKVPSLDDLELPDILKTFSCQPNGLVLVCGPTGSGKSTTLAAMLGYINSHHDRVVVTIEDPIEFLHPVRRCAFSQREVGQDTSSFPRALRHVLRQDPDVILVGEMRDQETMALAVTAAETGHLVFSTLHTNSATEAIDRVVDAFPAAQQNQIRLQLSMSLLAIIYQVLLPRAGGKGRIAACEILVATPAVRSLIREGKTHQIDAYLEMGSKSGMKTLAQAVDDLKRRKLIDRDAAAAYGKPLNA